MSSLKNLLNPVTSTKTGERARILNFSWPRPLRFSLISQINLASRAAPLLESVCAAKIENITEMDACSHTKQMMHIKPHIHTHSL